MSDILETVERLEKMKEDQAAVEAELRALVLAIQGVLGDAGAGTPSESQAVSTEADLVKPPGAGGVDYYSLPGKGIPEPLGPAPPPTRVETPREEEEDGD
jgi:hypothetical protein